MPTCAVLNIGRHPSLKNRALTVAFSHSRSPLLLLSRGNKSVAQRAGDLWGPLLLCLMLSVVLSLKAPADQTSLVFAAVFVIIWCGAFVVTLNAKLLGGKISFFQSVCVLGYCVFPLNISAVISLIVPLFFGGTLKFIVRLAAVVVGFVWSTRASVVFMSQLVKEERKVLAVYPVFLFYIVIGWIVMLH